MNETAPFRSWVPEPGDCGTAGLLWSCFGTIAFCTWSVISPNLAGNKERGSRVILRKIGYVAVCLVATEFVLFLAPVELEDAKSLQKKVGDTLIVKVRLS
jgi:hypothetical protein